MRTTRNSFGSPHFAAVCTLLAFASCSSEKSPSKGGGAGTGSGGSARPGAGSGGTGGGTGGAASSAGRGGTASGTGGGSASSTGGTSNAGRSATGGTSAAAGGGAAGSASSTLDHFSFFVTSLKAMQSLSNSDKGFGGDLRFGETGAGAGLRGADKICSTIAERSMPGASQKVWRAFLSATADENGKQVNAIDRIGEGPWYDRLGRLLAAKKADLLMDRPSGADSAIADDFPNEDGVPNHQPDPNQDPVDNHDVLTGSNAQGQLYSATATCKDWTSKLGDVASEGNPRVGHSWPRTGFPGGGFGGFPGGGFPGGGGPGGGGPGGGMVNMANWMSALDEAGCGPSVMIVENGPPNASDPTVGSGGGYGGIYCFALTP